MAKSRCTLLACGILASSFATAQLDQTGQWGPVLNWPLVAIHQHYLMTGKVLMWGRGDLGDYPELYDPLSNSFTALGAQASDIFCGGHSFLSDGTLLISGGHIADGFGTADSYIYNPFAGSVGVFNKQPDMTYGRWYPADTTMPDGRVVTLSGSISLNQDGTKNWAPAPEVFDPETHKWSLYPPNPVELDGYYRMDMVIPDGRVYCSGPTIWFSEAMDPATGQWTTVSNNSTVYGSAAVSYAPGKILKSGGATSEEDQTGSDTAAIIDFNAATPAWTNIQPMSARRREHDLSVLPDGTVLCTGGSLLYDRPDTAVFTAELFNPATNTWKTLPPMVTPRSYHSSAMLLADGRVIVAGGGNGGNRGHAGGSPDFLSAEIYSPPYLFKGARPQNLAMPQAVYYGRTFPVTTDNAANIAKVSLIAPASVTHGQDQNQRFIPLTFSIQGNKVIANAPASAKIAPPGPYMLFLVNKNGVPSVGQFFIVSEAMPDIAPSTVTSNGITQGQVSTLANTDGNDLKVFEIAPNLPYNVWVTITGTSPKKHISSMMLQLQSSFVTGFPIKIEYYDFEQAKWVTVATKTETSASTLKSCIESGYTSNFVDQKTGQVKARITWTVNGPTNGKTLAIDRIAWTVTR